LRRKGWTVYNYPDRLAYSATPPDSGSLLIQRRRWATGGLPILPNVFRYFLDSPSLRRLSEAFIRTQYIPSAPVGSSAILLLTLAPFEPGTAWSSWPLLAFLAYLLALQRDLMHNGNRVSDLVGAMALNAIWLDRWAVTTGVKNVDNVLDDFPEVPEFVVKAADGGT
jgi:cellulose synthase (UDP-forming)